MQVLSTSLFNFKPSNVSAKSANCNCPEGNCTCGITKGYAAGLKAQALAFAGGKRSVYDELDAMRRVYVKQASDLLNAKGAKDFTNALKDIEPDDLKVVLVEPCGDETVISSIASDYGKMKAVLGRLNKANKFEGLSGPEDFVSNIIVRTEKGERSVASVLKDGLDKLEPKDKKEMEALYGDYGILKTVRRGN